MTNIEKDALQAAVRDAVRDAVKQALTDAARDPQVVAAFVSAFFGAIQAQAQEASGRFVIGAVRAAVRLVLVFLALGVLIYSIGGWSALVTLFKAIAPHN